MTLNAVSRSSPHVETELEELFRRRRFVETILAHKVSGALANRNDIARCNAVGLAPLTVIVVVRRTERR
jgi:hypothetical protein